MSDIYHLNWEKFKQKYYSSTFSHHHSPNYLTNRSGIHSPIFKLYYSLSDDILDRIRNFCIQLEMNYTMVRWRHKAQACDLEFVKKDTTPEFLEKLQTGIWKIDPDISVGRCRDISYVRVVRRLPLIGNDKDRDQYIIKKYKQKIAIQFVIQNLIPSQLLLLIFKKYFPNYFMIYKPDRNQIIFCSVGNNERYFMS